MASRDTTGSRGRRIEIPNTTWDTNLTWNTVLGGTVHGGEALVAWPSNTWQGIDLTCLVRTWHTGTRTNCGIMLRSPEDNAVYSERWLYSSDAPTASNRPRLVIDYVPEEIVDATNAAFARSVIVTNGPAVFEDTYIASNDLNYASAPSVDFLQTWNTGTRWERRQRGLIRVLTDNPLLPVSYTHLRAHET